MNFDKESKFEDFFFFFFFFLGGGGGRVGEEREGEEGDSTEKNNRFSLIFLCSCSI